VAKQSHLKELILGKNEIGDIGIEYLIRACKPLEDLKRFDVSNALTRNQQAD
jgi:hypothetical protein